MNTMLLTALLLGQAQAPMPPQAPPIQEAGYILRSYAGGAETAVKQKRPLVTFVGYGRGRPLHAVVCCQINRLDGYDAPCVVVAVPVNDWLEWRGPVAAHA